MSWSTVRFEHLYKIPSKNGLNRPSRVRGNGYKMINMGELFANDRIGTIDMERVQLNEREFENMLVESGDLLFARQSLVLAGAGKCSIVKTIDEPTTFESHLIRVRLKSEIADPDFYRYYFKSPISPMKSIVTQGVQAGIRASDLAKLDVHLPPITTQRRIADILSAYDDLIENNRRRIDLLEQSARMLYKEWFVSLRFPGHEHVKVKDGVPQGWERVSLSKVAEVNRESLRSNFQGDIEYIDIASVSTGTIEETTLYSFEDAPGRARRVVKHGDIIWSCVRPNRKSYSVIWNPAENLIASTGFAVLSPNDVPTSFLLQATTTDDFVGYLSNNARGAAYPAVTGTDFEKATILVSTKMLLQQYNDFAEPLLSQIYTLQQHNRKMKQARDLLLPRLMNGEIPV
jgi:type I restriction enzyme S subunit